MLIDALPRRDRNNHNVVERAPPFYGGRNGCDLADATLGVDRQSPPSAARANFRNDRARWPASLNLVRGLKGPNRMLRTTLTWASRIGDYALSTTDYPGRPWDRLPVHTSAGAIFGETRFVG